MTTTDKIEYLSWSKVQTYRQCGKKFEYQYIDRVPAERKAAALVFGGAFHRGVESVHQARLEGAPVPAVPELLSTFEAAWKEETKDGPPVEFSKTDNYQSLRELAGRMLDAYRRFVLAERKNGEVLAIEEEGWFEIGEAQPPFMTRLDLLERFGDELHITDVKTAKRQYDEAKVREVQLQLVTYAHSVMGIVKTLAIKKVVPKIELITKAKTPTVQVIAPPTSQAHVERLRETVSEVWGAIGKGVFVAHESWQCRDCPFRDRCRG